MCAIFSCNNISKFEILYEANKERGKFASSVMVLTDTNEQGVYKCKGDLSIERAEIYENAFYYIGHVQAPTSDKRVWQYDTSHPFESLSWSVVHNGVITNWKKINDEFTPWNVNTVDTSIIPALLQHFTEECTGLCPAHASLSKTLSLLEGTFAVICVDTDSNDIYIARQGSILHFNDNGDVSTIPGNGFVEVPEGIIYMLQDNKWVQVDTFNLSSPFLFI